MKILWPPECPSKAEARKLFKKMVAKIRRHDVAQCFVVGSQLTYCLVKEIAGWNYRPSNPFTISMSVKPEIRVIKREGTLGWSQSGLVFTLWIGVTHLKEV